VVSAAFETSLGQLDEAGVQIVDVTIPELEHAAAAEYAILLAEASAVHDGRYREHRAEYGLEIRRYLATGDAVLAIDYIRALRHCRRFRRDVEALMPPFDALLMPAAPGPAPRGLASTGDASFCAPWSFAGVPAIALPSGVAADGLPQSVQLVAAPWREATLLRAARFVEPVLAFGSQPR